MSFISTPPYATNPSKHIYTPKGWNDTWLAAKNASGTTPAWIYFHGDSIWQGPVCTNFATKSFWALVAAGVLAQGWSRYADFWPCALSADFLTFSGGTYNGTPPWVINSVTNRGYLSWANARPLQYSAANAANPLATFTTPYACTSFDFLHMPNGAGSWQYSVDGGATQTVNVTATGAYTRLNVASLANTTHTITVFNTSAANALILDGIVTYNSTTSGIGFANCCVSGNSASAYTSSANSPVPRTGILMGREKTTSPVGNFGFPTQPHLALIELGINDNNGANGLDNFEYSMQAIIDAYRSGRQNTSLLIACASNPSGISSDVTTAFSTFSPFYSKQVQLQRQMADAYNCAFVNFHADWGGTGVARGYQGAAQIHPTDSGHLYMANAVLGII